MTLVDTSAWIEYLRATGSTAHHRVRALLEDGESITTSEPIAMELLAGARDDVHLRSLKRLLSGLQLAALAGLNDFEDAADLFRHVRRQGETVRSLVDCLIATVALRNDLDLLHWDADFETVARHSTLKQSRG